jgi:hypothetical protein
MCNWSSKRKEKKRNNEGKLTNWGKNVSKVSGKQLTTNRKIREKI